MIKILDVIFEDYNVQILEKYEDLNKVTFVVSNTEKKVGITFDFFEWNKKDEEIIKFATEKLKEFQI